MTRERLMTHGGPVAVPVAVEVFGRRLAVPAAVAPVMVAGAAAAACVVVRLVDPSETSLFPPCPFRAVSGLDCPGCGSTRALHHLLGGSFATAAGFNLMFVAALPYLVWLWLAWAVPRLGGPRLPGRRLSPSVISIVLGAAVAFTVVRNLPFDPFRALGTD